MIDAQRKLELGSRALLLASMFPPAWVVGTAGLSIAKIIENMEIGHNVMHGQWDWMRDPKIHSTTWEWDNASPSEQWKHSHNELHHTYTNVIGKDNDLGYGIMRVDEDQRWVPLYLAQPLWNFVNACFFEYGIAAYDLELGKNLQSEKRRSSPEFKARAKVTLKKIRQQMTKDYVVHPLLSGPSALTTLTANMTANLVRNLWTHSVIMCGHFPEGVQTFERRSIEGETRGEWYLRQMLGSANITGSKVMHFMTGNLSFQIEHHLFPDLPSNRYAEIAPQVQALFDEVRPALRHRLAAPPGRLRVAEGHPALAAERPRRKGTGRRARARAAPPPVVPRSPPRPDPRSSGNTDRRNSEAHRAEAALQVLLIPSRSSRTRRLCAKDTRQPVSRRGRSTAWPRRVRIPHAVEGTIRRSDCVRGKLGLAPRLLGGLAGGARALGHVSRSVVAGRAVPWLCDSTLVGRRPAHWYQPSSSSRGCVIKFAGVRQRLSGTKVPGPGQRDPGVREGEWVEDLAL